MDVRAAESETGLVLEMEMTKPIGSHYTRRLSDITADRRWLFCRGDADRYHSVLNATITPELLKSLAGYSTVGKGNKSMHGDRGGGGVVCSKAQCCLLMLLMERLFPF